MPWKFLSRRSFVQGGLAFLSSELALSSTLLSHGPSRIASIFRYDDENFLSQLDLVANSKAPVRLAVLGAPAGGGHTVANFVFELLKIKQPENAPQVVRFQDMTWKHKQSRAERIVDQREKCRTALASMNASSSAVFSIRCAFPENHHFICDELARNGFQFVSVESGNIEQARVLWTHLTSNNLPLTRPGSGKVLNSGEKVRSPKYENFFNRRVSSINALKKRLSARGEVVLDLSHNFSDQFKARYSSLNFDQVWHEIVPS